MGRERGGSSCLQKSDCVRNNIQTERDASDAEASFALFLCAVQRMWTVQKVQSDPARHSVFVVVELILLDGANCLVSW